MVYIMSGKNGDSVSNGHTYIIMINNINISIMAKPTIHITRNIDFGNTIVIYLFLKS